VLFHIGLSLGSYFCDGKVSDASSFPFHTGYAFYFSVNDDEAVAILFNDTIDTVEMENVVYELRNEMLQYLFS